MADVNWRAVPFLEQTTGNYPDASDVADKDNIFLTEQGWVYRHFKSLDKSEYWDEVIWAGYVDASVQANDPVDTIGAPNDDITFLVGDGFQFVSGDYPATVSTIGTVTVNGPDEVTVDSAEAYTAQNDGSFSGTKTYQWKVKDNQGNDVSSDANTVVISAATSATTNITYKIAGSYNVSVTVGDQAGAVASQTGGETVVAAAATVDDTIDSVTVTGDSDIFTATDTVYTVTYTGTAPIGDVTFALTANPSANITITASGQPSGKSQDYTVRVLDAVAGGTAITLTGAVSDPDVNSGTPVAGTAAVTSYDKIGTVTVTTDPTIPAAGTAGQAITSAASGAKGTPAGSTYSWAVTTAPTGGDTADITFADAAAQNTTFSVDAGATVGDYTITCTWGQTGAKPATSVGTITLSVGAASTASTPTTTYTTTVAAKTSNHPYFGSGSTQGYYLNGIESPLVSVSAGDIIRWDQSDSSNSGHPLRLYLDGAKYNSYTTGVTTNGTPGTAGAYTQLVVTASTPTTLHYQCSNHGYMGWKVEKS